MHEADVDMISAQFAARTVEISAGGDGGASPRFRQHGDFIARDLLQGFGDVRVTAVGISRIEEGQASVAATQEQVADACDAESSRLGMMTAADSAGSHGEPAGLAAGLAARQSSCRAAP